MGSVIPASGEAAGAIKSRYGSGGAQLGPDWDGEGHRDAAEEETKDGEPLASLTAATADRRPQAPVLVVATRQTNRQATQQERPDFE